MSAAMRQPGIVYPDGTEFDPEGYPRYWSARYGCWLYPVVWNTATGVPIYSVQPKQWELLKLTPLLRLPGAPGPTRIGFGGAAGGGKSYLARVIATMTAHLWPGSACAIVRESEKQLKDNHLTPFMREVPQELYSINRQDMEVRWKATGSITYFRYLRHEKDLGNFQGPAFDVLIFEEGTLLDWNLIHWILGNRNRSSVSGTTPFAVIPTNPGGQGHHEFVRLFIERRFNAERDERPEDYAFLPAKLEDNYILRTEDPAYIRKLNTLPEPYRSWQRDGDFSAGAGRALPMLHWDRHRIHVFDPPPHWTVFGAFDWGFQHPFSFGWYCVNEDGRVFKGDTITGRHLSDREIGDRIIHALRDRGIRPDRFSYIVAGHDCWDEIKARASGIPTTAETLQQFGLHLIRANTSRIAGLKQLRKMLEWERTLLNGAGELVDDDPFLRFMDTPNNRKCFAVLQTRVPDPHNIEDVLKTDADAFGEGGDDPYDETRYALASRPSPARSLIRSEPVSAFAPAVLAHEADESHRVRSTPPRPTTGVVHPEFGYID
jgi:phage terminase large subunit